MKTTNQSFKERYEARERAVKHLNQSNRVADKHDKYICFFIVWLLAVMIFPVVTLIITGTVLAIIGLRWFCLKYFPKSFDGHGYNDPR